MKIEEVISLAQQAIDFHPPPVFYPMSIKALEKFANLVAEKEREECAQIGQTLKIPAGACAVSGHAWDSATIEYMRAIRARGQK